MQFSLLLGCKYINTSRVPSPYNYNRTVMDNTNNKSYLFTFYLFRLFFYKSLESMWALSSATLHTKTPEKKRERDCVFLKGNNIVNKNTITVIFALDNTIIPTHLISFVRVKEGPYISSHMIHDFCKSRWSSREKWRTSTTGSRSLFVDNDLYPQILHSEKWVKAKPGKILSVYKLYCYVQYNTRIRFQLFQSD